ncbi:hypothetical protein, conserved [Eimeria tenella]|uniref:Uncharacterized protein n=1 Tax=Eimeria tenella TaxID=5802 RepID=U6KK64_EIMTE|nr:hypothetical protein, conserved [Eimeria tenella]CDJ38390.1 hypothetical protein, conserved [Eimeria tenella]|eukprot:XP_013229228.1 hypothetical protein, conserved [Eimeria tenella]
MEIEDSSSSPLVALDASRTFVPAAPVSASRVEQHKLERPYWIRGQYLEDGIGDVSSQSFSDAISNAIGHLGALASSAREVWGPRRGPPPSSVVCFHEGDPGDRSDCHEFAAAAAAAGGPPLLPAAHQVETAAVHSGWSGASHLLLFDKSKAPFLFPFLENNFSFGLPPGEARWRGRWLVKPTRDPAARPAAAAAAAAAAAGGAAAAAGTAAAAAALCSANEKRSKKEKKKKGKERKERMNERKDF